MNIFRLCGDMSHVLAIILLLLKIYKSKKVEGEFPSNPLAPQTASSAQRLPLPDAACRIFCALSLFLRNQAHHNFGATVRRRELDSVVLVAADCLSDSCCASN
jgi:hypothetical protein